MKIKLNWGNSIVIAFVLFMTFILSFVYKAVFIEKYEHHLVSEDYYKDELLYQEEIDKMNNAQKLKKNIGLRNSVSGIVIEFPDSMDFQKISGNIYFLKRSNHLLDFERKIELESHSVLIDDQFLVSGKWEIKIDWKYEGISYLLKESWFYE